MVSNTHLVILQQNLYLTLELLQLVSVLLRNSLRNTGYVSHRRRAEYLDFVNNHFMHVSQSQQQQGRYRN